MSTLSFSHATAFYLRHESKLITAVVVLLSVYLLSFAAKLTWQLFPNDEQAPTSTRIQSNAASNDINESASTNINKLLRLNLFGNAEAQATPVVVQQNEDVPETSLNLVLSGVVASNTPKLGAAVIEYRNQQDTYGIGDKVQGTNVILDEIFADRVIIKNRLARETLMLEGLDFDEANQKRAQQTNIDLRAQTETIPADVIRPNARAIQDARAKLAQSPESFAELISLSPHRVNEELIGYRVSPGANPSLFNAVGLKNGDIVVQLNGLDLSDIQQSLEALTELQEADALQLELMRGNDFVSLDLEIPSGNEDE